MTGTPPSIKLQHLLLDNNDCIIIGGVKQKMRKLTEETMDEKPTKSITKIIGKVITIIGFETFRGKPTKFTTPDAIGQDGLTEYNKITTLESFKLGDEQVENFFLNKACTSLLRRNVTEGGEITPQEPLKVEVYTHKGKSSDYTYLKNVDTKTQEKIG